MSTIPKTHDSEEAEPHAAGSSWFAGLDELNRAATALEGLLYAAGAAPPRPPGLRYSLTLPLKDLLARLFTWHTPPLRRFDACVARSVREIFSVLEHLSMNMIVLDQLSMDIAALEGRLGRSENGRAALANRAEPGTKLPANGDGRRTAYVIGLFGTGRRYINELIERNLGPRAKYLRDTIRLHPGPTPMIYSGHVTMKYLSRGQEPPALMRRILESVRSGFADVVFIYRHPLDSLLSNWIWWRTYLRDHHAISGWAQVYNTIDDLCVDLEKQFFEFKAFAAGDRDFFAAMPGPPFLSFRQFVEETALHRQSARLALRLEDFAADPRREFSRIAEVMSVDLGAGLPCPDPPRARPYTYPAVREKVPLFRSFIERLDKETTRRIEQAGYEL